MTKQNVAKVVLAFVLAAGTSGLLLRAQNPQNVGEWVATGPVAELRSGAASAVLADGTTMVLGGRDTDGNSTTAVTIYDPVTNGLATIGQLSEPRAGHSASLLADGRIAVIGGSINEAPTADIEIFNPATGTSTFGGALPQARMRHAAATLKDGRVLIAGGNTPNADGTGLDVLATAELYDPATGSTSPVSGSLNTGRAGASATTLLDGTVLIAGGYDAGQNDLAGAELFHPDSAGAFTIVPTSLSQPRSGHTAILLPNNNGVLIAGGRTAGVAVTTVDLFLPAIFPDPYSYGVGTMVSAGSLTAARARAFSGPKGDDGYAYVAGGGVETADQYRFATIRTDKDDYAPGTKAIITGSGWTPNAPVTLLFQEDPAVHDDYVLTVLADGNGNIDYRDWAPEEHDLNVRFYLTATDGASHAQMTFTDSANITVNAATFVWHRTGEGSAPNGFDVAISGGYTCTTSTTAMSNCTGVNAIVVTVAGVTGSKNATFSGATWNATLQFRTSGGDFVVPPNGRFTVVATLKTNLADQAATRSAHFGVDNTAPSTSITCDDAACAGTYSHDVTVKLAGTDPGVPNSGSGLNQRLYCVDDSSDACVPSTVYSGSSGFTVQYSSGATAYVRYRSTDTAGNTETTKSQPIVFSTAGPQVAAPGGTQSSDEGTLHSWDLGSFSDLTFSAAGWTVDVDWGDTTTTTFDAGSPGALDNRSHTYADGVASPASTYTITVKVTNKTSNQNGQTTFEVRATNVVPNVTAPSNQTASQNVSKSIALGSFADPGTIDGPWDVDVNWGDGSPHTTFTMASPGTITAQDHAYTSTAGSPYTVTVKVADKDYPAGGTATFTVALNTAPSVSFTTGPATTDEGDTKTYNFAIIDPDAGQTFSFVSSFPDCGTGNAVIGGSASIDSAAKTGTFQCSFPDGPATPTVRVQVQDSYSTPAASNIDPVSVTVANVEPTIAISGNANVNEGSSYSLTLGAITDPGQDTVTSWVVHWGDGSIDTYGSAGAKSHIYADGPNDYSITIDLVDANGTFVDRANALSAHVDNVAPTVTFTAGPIVVSESGTTQNTYEYSIDEPGDDTIASVSASCGTEGTKAPGSDTHTNTSGKFTCIFRDGPATLQVTAGATDSDGATSVTATRNVTVDNVEPSIAISGHSNVNEGSSYSLTLGTITDPGQDSVTNWIVHWGDGSSSTYGTEGIKTHTYVDGPNSFNITVDLVDEDGTSVNKANALAIAVNNVKPELGSISAGGNTTTACVAGNTVTLNFGFTDPAGSYDTYTGVIEWGDGSTTSFSSSPVIDAQHSYAPGTYTITVQVNDEDPGAGASDTVAVSLLYQTSGFLQPINADGSSNFRLGSTIPLKVRITDCSGTAVTTLSPEISLKVVGGGSGDVNEAVSSSAADNGNTMRFDPSGPQYIFNLSTKRSQFNAGQDLAHGRYELQISDATVNAKFSPVIVQFATRK
jgi:hypothetical protein